MATCAAPVEQGPVERNGALGPTNYNPISSGQGHANSNAGAARVLEVAKPGSSDDKGIRPNGYAPGWSRPDAVGAAPKPPEEPTSACVLIGKC